MTQISSPNDESSSPGDLKSIQQQIYVLCPLLLSQPMPTCKVVKQRILRQCFGLVTCNIKLYLWVMYYKRPSKSNSSFSRMKCVKARAACEIIVPLSSGISAVAIAMAASKASWVILLDKVEIVTTTML